MKILIPLFLVMLTYVATAQPKDAILLGYKGKVKQVKVHQYKFDLSKDDIDSVLYGESVSNFDQDGNLQDEEIKHLETGIVIKKVYRYNPQKIISAAMFLLMVI